MCAKQILELLVVVASIGEHRTYSVFFGFLQAVAAVGNNLVDFRRRQVALSQARILGTYPRAMKLDAYIPLIIPSLGFLEFIHTVFPVHMPLKPVTESLGGFFANPPPLFQ